MADHRMMRLRQEDHAALVKLAAARKIERADALALVLSVGFAALERGWDVKKRLEHSGKRT